MDKEKLNYLVDLISLKLAGDVFLQQCFEIICKHCDLFEHYNLSRVKK